MQDEKARQLGAKAAMKAQARQAGMPEDARQKMVSEIDDLLTHKLQETSGRGITKMEVDNKAKFN